MEKEISYNKEIESALSITKSLEFLFTSSSAIRMRLFESDKYCKYAENNLKLSKTKILSLLDARNKAIKIRDELMNRDKVNITSLESLFQIQSELYHFKCDVKAEFIKAEEAIRSKKVKFENIIISYKSRWEEVQEAYKKLPLASELLIIEQQNEALLEELNNLNNLFEQTKIDFWNKYGILMNDLYKKIIEFTNEYQNYLKLLQLSHEMRQKNIQMQELLQKLWKSDFTLQNPPFFNKISLKTTVLDSRKEENKSFSNLTDFDDVLIPLENLELQTEDGSFIYANEGDKEKFDHENLKIIHKPEKPNSVIPNRNHIKLNCFKNDFRRETGDHNDMENKGDSKNCANLSEDNHDNDSNETKSMPSESEKGNDADATSRYWKLEDKEANSCVKPLKVAPNLKKKGRIGLNERKVKQVTNGRAKGESLPKRLKCSVENKNFFSESSNLDKSKILDELIFPVKDVKSLCVDQAQETQLNKEKEIDSEIVQKPSVDILLLPKGNETATPIFETFDEESVNNKFMFFMDGTKSVKKEKNSSIFNLF